MRMYVAMGCSPPIVNIGSVCDAPSLGVRGFAAILTKKAPLGLSDNGWWIGVVDGWDMELGTSEIDLLDILLCNCNSKVAHSMTLLNLGSDGLPTAR